MRSYPLRPAIPDDVRAELAEHSDFMAHLLHHRGIATGTAAKEFFVQSYEKLHDPFLLKDMEKAVERIFLAMRNKETICIFSDYDADGIPAAVVLSDFFDKIGYAAYFVYIPHRNKEGFGLNHGAIDTIAERKATLMITLDCGITDVEETAYATECGIDVIITDHHEASSALPAAFAIINPKQEDCTYPEKMLCGSGVTFKLVQALVARGQDFDLPAGWEKTLLDMVGIATLSDMVPLTGENRLLASFGLTVLRMSPRKGLQKLLRKGRLDQRLLNEDDVGFSISPKINAASRMDAPEVAFQMLKARDYASAGALVDRLYAMNDERKGHVAAMVKEVKHRVLADDRSGVIVAGNVKWQPSLLGLAANTLCEEYGRPVFLWGRGEGSDLKGSCRSATVSVIDLLGGVPSTVLETYGGHHQAGGFVVRPEAVDFLYDELMKVYSTYEEAPLPETFADYALSLDQIDDALWRDLDKLAPFGQGHAKPLFLLLDVRIRSLRQFGKRKEHLSLTLEQTDPDGISAARVCEKEAIAFFKSPDSWKTPLAEGQVANVVAHVEKNNFGGNGGLRLRIVDIV